MWITPSISSLSKNDQLKPIDGSVADFGVNRDSLSFHAENADRLLKKAVQKLFYFKSVAFFRPFQRHFKQKQKFDFYCIFLFQ